MIKLLLPFLFLPIAGLAQSSDEILMGSLTYHFFSDVSDRFDNKLDSNGTWIANPMAAFRRINYDNEHSFWSWTLFAGENSIGEGMGGGVLSMGIGNNKRRLGIVGGAYLQDPTKFADRGIMTFGNVSINRNVALVPAVGWELAFNWDLTKRTYITFYNLLTPAFYTNSLGIGWRI